MRCVGLLVDCGRLRSHKYSLSPRYVFFGRPEILISEFQVLDSVATSLKDKMTPASIPELRRRGPESRMLPLRVLAETALKRFKTSGAATGLVTMVNPSLS